MAWPAGFSRIIRSNAAGLVIALALAGFLAVQALAAFPYQNGIDFYQFWGVPVAKRLSGTGETPYVDPPAYARVLNALADASESRKLREANRQRRAIEPMGTPFLYASFAAFAGEFERAQAFFVILQYLAAGAAVYMLARLRDVARWPAAWIALLVELTFTPFLQDVRVGNVNSMQLLVVAALLHVALRRLYSGHALIGGLFVGVLAVFVVFKPNTPWIALAFAIHYAVVMGARRFLVGAGLAALLGALAVGVGAWYFGGAHAWAQWLAYARGMDGSGLALTIDQGNLSLPMLLARLSHAYGPMGFGLVLAAALAVALLLAASAGGRRSELAAPTLRAAFADPWFAASLGVVFTFATSPLLWPHYLVFALVPIFWLARIDGAARMGAAGAALCYGLLSLPLISLLAAYGLYGGIQAAMVFSWVALLPGVFAYVAHRNRALQAAA